MIKKNISFLILSGLLLYSGWLSSAVEQYPSRVVSLGPYITENLLLLNINDEIKGVTIHEKPEIKEGRVIVGTLLDPNIETIINLKPDIVIASKEGNRKQTVEKLLDLGINVVVLDEVRTYENLKTNFINLASIFGKRDIAEKIISEIDSELVSYKQKKSLKKKKILWQLGTKPIVTAGKDTYFNEISIYAGALNIFGDMKSKYITVNVEEIIRRNPDIIIAMGMGESVEISEFWKPFKNINAVRNKKIFRVNDYDFCSPTPASFLKSVRFVKNLLEN